MRGRGNTKIPEFRSLEEEREYWETRGPLAQERKGRINKPKPGQRRSSFLAVRLTGEELTRLRDVAAKQGLGPSTFARVLLTSATELGGKLPKIVTLDELKDILEQALPQSVKDKAEALAKVTAIGDPNSPTLLVLDASQMKKSEELAWSLFGALLSIAGVRVVMPEDKGYEKLRDLMKAEARKGGG